MCFAYLVYLPKTVKLYFFFSVSNFVEFWQLLAFKLLVTVITRRNTFGKNSLYHLIQARCVTIISVIYCQKVFNAEKKKNAFATISTG